VQLAASQRASLDWLTDIGARHHLVTFRPSVVFVDLLTETAPQILIRAANRVGKTRHVAWLVAKRMVEQPGYRARVVGPTHSHIHKVLGKYLADFLTPYLAPGSRYVHGKGWGSGRVDTIILANGSTCELKSLKDDVEAHSGTSLHLVAMDEPPTPEHYVENAARVMDTGGQLIVAATMVGRSVRWLRELVQGKGEVDAPAGRTMHPSGWLQIVAQFSRANCPWYSQEQVEQWLEVMRASAWQWAQRIEAAWDGVTLERLFTGVSERTFTFDDPEGRSRIGLGIDHGEVQGHQAAVLVAYTGTRTFVIDEYLNEIATTPEEDAHAILQMLAAHRIDPTHMDIAVGDLNTSKGFAGYSVNEALQEAFAQQLHRKTPPFVIQPADKARGSVDWGLRCINAAALRGELQVHHRCHHLSQCLKHWKGTTRGEDGKLAHIADAFRYVLVAAIGSHASYARLRFD